MKVLLRMARHSSETRRPQSAVRLYAAQIAAGQSKEAGKLVSDWVKANPKDLTLRTYLAERSLAEQKYDQGRAAVSSDAGDCAEESHVT